MKNRYTKNMLHGVGLVLATTAVSPAFAQEEPENTWTVPDPVMISTPGYNCMSGAAKRQFDAGFEIGFSMVWRSWMSSGMERNAVASFVADAANIATRSIAGGLAPIDPVAVPQLVPIGCRIWGSLSGLMEGVSDVLDKVILSCRVDGAYYADFAAQVYCELADNFGPIAAQPLIDRAQGPCSTAFETSCTQVHEAKVADYLTQQGNHCSELITGDYRAGYVSALHNSCTHEVALPEEEDVAEPEPSEQGAEAETGSAPGDQSPKPEPEPTDQVPEPEPEADQEAEPADKVPEAEPEPEVDPAGQSSEAEPEAESADQVSEAEPEPEVDPTGQASEAEPDSANQVAEEESAEQAPET